MRQKFLQLLQKILYILILFSCTWLCILISRNTGFGGYIREQIEGYLVDYSTPSTSNEKVDDEDKLNKDQLELRSLRQAPQDSVVIILLTKTLQTRKGILQVIDELMPAGPAVVGIDVFFEDKKDSLFYVDEIKKRTFLYSNLVIGYSRPNEMVDNTSYPLGATDYNDFPNMGYTNFGLEGKEVRYLALYAQVDGEERPAFWTVLWSKSHSDKQGFYEFRSRRRFINFNLEDNDSQVLEISTIADLHKPYHDVFPSPLEAIKGKMVIVGWIGDRDYLIVPVHDGEHTKPGIEVIGIALNTIVLNERSSSFADRYRDLIASIVLLLLCAFFAYSCETKFYSHWSNLIQFVLGLILFVVAPFIPLSHDEAWTVFSMIVVFVLITPAIDDCYRHILEKIDYLKGKKSNNEE